MNPESGRPTYRWPWFVLAALILAIVLAILWMSDAVRETRKLRDLNRPPPSGPAAPSQPVPPRLLPFSDLLHGGNAASGRKIFVESPAANCIKCHKVGGEGGDNGPALDGIASRHDRVFLLESLIFPNAVINTNYETAIVLLNNGTGTSGTIHSETETELVLQTPDDGPVTIQKSEIQIRQRGASPMPEGLDQILSRAEIRDLIEYLATLKD